MAIDNEDYWLRRHVEFRGDVRSTGHLGKSVEENIRGYGKKIGHLRDQIEEQFQRVAGLEILELGCGTGLMAPSLIESGAIYTGLDVSPVAREQARQLAPEGCFVEGNLVDFRMDHCFDLVFLTDVLLHVVDDQNWTLALANIFRHVKYTGLALIKEDIGEERLNPAPHVVLRNRIEYSTMCRDFGFRFDTTISPGFFLLRPEGTSLVPSGEED